MRESALVRKIIKAVRTKYPNAYVRKISDRYTRGLPDLLIVFESNIQEMGVTLLVETKMEGGILSKIQEAEMKAIDKAGGILIVATSADDVLIVMERMGALKH